MARFHVITNAATGEVTQEPFTLEEEVEADAQAVVANAAAAKQAAIIRIRAIREELVEHLAANLAGTPAEKGQALAAIGLLRAEMAIEKGKL